MVDGSVAAIFEPANGCPASGTARRYWKLDLRRPRSPMPNSNWYYQPLIDTMHYRITGFEEHYLRW